MRLKQAFATLFLSVLILAGCAAQDPPQSGGPESAPPPNITVEETSTGKVLRIAETEELLILDFETGGQELPAAKDEGPIPVVVKLTVGEETAKFPANINVQGSSTAGWPKKNWSVKLTGEDDSPELLQVGGSIASNKWIAKAEWIDPSQARNQLAFRLWGDMVNSREGDAALEVLNSDAEHHHGAQGFPATFPALVEVNGDHYGLATLTLGHDPRNFNIDQDNPQHAYFEFDARGGEDETKTWEKFRAELTGHHFDNYLSDDNEFTESHLSATDRLGELFNGPQDVFAEQFDTHFDRQNMIDMLLFLEVINDYDAVAQDIEFVSYDGEKWYLLPWDKDTTFGLRWDDQGIGEGLDTSLLIDYEAENDTQKPWYKTYTAFTSEVEERYGQLREMGVFTVENLAHHVDQIYGGISEQMWQAEQERWEEEGRLPLEEADSQQILDWFQARLRVLDNHFGYSV